MSSRIFFASVCAIIIKAVSSSYFDASHEFDSDMQDGADDRNNTKSGARRKFRGIDELTDDKSDIIDEQNGFTESSINIKA